MKIMRKNPYEKIRRALFILLVVMLVTAACVIGVMLIKHTHNAEKNKVRETTAGTENATEKIKETEADTEYYFDEDGYLKVKKIKADGSGSNTENEQDNAPDVRDVSPEDDPNAVFPETTDAVAGQSAEQTQDISQPFQRYFLSMMATSKENIFAHSDEIEVRKQIKNELYEFIGTLNEEQKEILSVQSSLIESVYRYRSDFYSADDDISCQDFLNGWMKSVMS